MSPLKALGWVLARVCALRFWPGDPVRTWGEPRTYVRLTGSGFHVVETPEGRRQLCPPESVRRSGC